MDPAAGPDRVRGRLRRAHHQANALLSPNDENAPPIITYLKETYHLKPYRFPTTGQDATLVGLQDIISGYQCGTVYKPIFLEAQAAATLALFARAKVAAPKTFVNGTTEDTTGKVKVPSVLLEPEWVVGSTIQKTVVADRGCPPARSAQSCTQPIASGTASTKHGSEVTISRDLVRAAAARW